VAGGRGHDHSQLASSQLNSYTQVIIHGVGCDNHSQMLIPSPRSGSQPRRIDSTMANPFDSAPKHSTPSPLPVHVQELAACCLFGKI